MQTENLKENLKDFELLISKISLQFCCKYVLPELGVRWTELRQAVRNARLPMTSASVAKILKRNVSKNMTKEEVDDIVAQLRIKAIALSTSRTWHAINLHDPLTERESVATWTKLVTNRVQQAIRRTIKSHNTFAEVNSSKIGDFMFFSIRLVHPKKEGSILYVAAQPNEPVAFVTSMTSGNLIQAVVYGLGYKKYSDPNLYGQDLESLLRIADRRTNTDINQLTDPVDYNPVPVITKNSIDYTNILYNKSYVDNLIGPNPPLINHLEITSERQFFDPNRLNKKMRVQLLLKSDDVSKTLKSWVDVKAIPPTSHFFKIFNEIKTNKFTYYRDSD